MRQQLFIEAIIQRLSFITVHRVWFIMSRALFIAAVRTVVTTTIGTMVLKAIGTHAMAIIMGIKGMVKSTTSVITTEDITGVKHIDACVSCSLRLI